MSDSKDKTLLDFEENNGFRLLVLTIDCANDMKEMSGVFLDHLNKEILAEKESLKKEGQTLQDERMSKKFGTYSGSMEQIMIRCRLLEIEDMIGKYSADIVAIAYSNIPTTTWTEWARDNVFWFIPKDRVSGEHGREILNQMSSHSDAILCGLFGYSKYSPTIPPINGHSLTVYVKRSKINQFAQTHSLLYPSATVAQTSLSYIHEGEDGTRNDLTKIYFCSAHLNNSEEVVGVGFELIVGLNLTHMAEDVGFIYNISTHDIVVLIPTWRLGSEEMNVNAIEKELLQIAHPKGIPNDAELPITVNPLRAMAQYRPTLADEKYNGIRLYFKMSSNSVDKYVCNHYCPYENQFNPLIKMEIQTKHKFATKPLLTLSKITPQFDSSTPKSINLSSIDVQWEYDSTTFTPGENDLICILPVVYLSPEQDTISLVNALGSGKELQQEKNKTKRISTFREFNVAPNFVEVMRKRSGSSKAECVMMYVHAFDVASTLAMVGSAPVEQVNEIIKQHLNNEVDINLNHQPIACTKCVCVSEPFDFPVSGYMSEAEV
ncbi:hypothetical protein SNEBB_000980 [Seison nebaliae]|nr:hypothetical protein SNEBB_000980 [Seison nebaliae]